MYNWSSFRQNMYKACALEVYLSINQHIKSYYETKKIKSTRERTVQRERYTHHVKNDVLIEKLKS